MRNVLCSSLVSHARDPDFIFLTGDLGFQALEPLQSAAGERFINAGVAEQNMVSAAAGLAWTGLRPWVYSIAPFVYARPYEQIRNDVCMHDMPVKIVGNGGGYGYGVMGATHHALGDYGALLCLERMHAFVPAFAADISPLVDFLVTFEHPAYLRLGRCELRSWDSHRLPTSPGGNCCAAPARRSWPLVRWSAPSGAPPPKCRNHVGLTFGCSRSSLIQADAIPLEFFRQFEKSRHLIVVEEHVAQGGAGQMLAHALMLCGQRPEKFVHHFARGYPSGCYGSQIFHREECGLDPRSILAELTG